MNKNQKIALDVLTHQGKNAQVIEVGKLWIPDFGMFGDGFFITSKKVAVDGAPLTDKVFWAIVNNCVK